MKILKFLRKCLSLLKYSAIFFVVAFPALAKGAESYFFNYPVGYPDSTGYYDAQDFGTWNNEFGGYHLGEDWNKSCGGDCELSKPLFSIASGTVKKVGYRRGWGNVLLISYKFGREEVVALYGHLQSVYVSQGNPVKPGDQIGTIGKGDRNRFSAHLHFEIRNDPQIEFGTGYGKMPGGRIDPSTFIDFRRPVKIHEITLNKEEDKSIRVSWGGIS